MDEKCIHYPNQFLNGYCEDCDYVICIRCRVLWHKTHNVVTLSHKCKHVKKELDQFERKRNKLKWQRNNLESCAEKVKETIHRQYCNVKNGCMMLIKNKLLKLTMQ